MGEEDQQVSTGHRRHCTSRTFTSRSNFPRRITDALASICWQTRHDYEITHKFTWKCSGCDASYVPSTPTLKT